MKRLTLSLVALLVPAALGAQSIVGTDHDFSTDGWNTTGEICIVCHTPHNADVSVTNAPLWNHQVTVATFALYSGATLDATMSQPDGASKLCLSCHDGTIALDNFGGKTDGTPKITGDALLGTDLSNDHPVSFTYDAALATTDGGLYDPTTVNSGMGGTIDDDMLFGGELQCSSCHDVHNGSGEAHLLVKANTGSGLCLTCHNK